MLQFIAKENDKYSIAELVQMAIEGGCKWVQLHLPEMEDSEIRELALEVVPLCKETSTILTIEDHVELAKELGIHGVLLVKDSADFLRVREFCGPEAIIGVQIGIASAALPMRNADVDYFAFTPNMAIERLSENVEALKAAEVMIPLVAVGDYPIDKIADVMATGVNGIALGNTIADSSNPVDTTSEILTLLTSLK